MEKKRNNKIEYVPPTAEITNVVLERVITASPVQKVELKDWDPDPNPNDVKNHADVWLDM